MAKDNGYISGIERFFADDEIIVSKTDMTGRITYANQIFQQVAGYQESELLGQPHSIVRHPEMPRSIFKMLWDTLAAQQEIFAYVVNLSKNGDHYWVLAHVTLSRNTAGEVTGYHSSRRVPDRTILEQVIQPLYQDLLTIERKHDNRKSGMMAAVETVQTFLKEKGMQYDEFIHTLTPSG